MVYLLLLLIFSGKRKLVKNCVYNFGEIDNCRQFHQHCTHAFNLNLNFNFDFNLRLI